MRILHSLKKPGADLRFPTGTSILRQGVPTYYLAKVPRKLHDNLEEVGKGPGLKFYYVDPPLKTTALQN